MPDQSARRFAFFLVVLAIALAALIARPFWEAYFLAAVLAAAFHPSMDWLARHLGGRRSLAAVLLVLGVLLAILVPLAGLGTLVVREVIDGVNWFRQALASEGVEGLLHRLPGFVESAARKILQAMPDPAQRLQRLAGAQTGQAAAVVGGLLAATGDVLFKAAMMLIAFFFFLVDGERLVDWIDANVPLGPGQFRGLLADFRKTTVSVLAATFATAGIQALTAFVGYLLFRAPNPIFLALVTFVIALVPALGGTVAVIAVALLQMATGHLLLGLGLAAWGIALVAVVDNVARPYLLKGGMELHGGIVFFSLLGGVAAFGGIGLVAGPLVVTFLISALRTWRRERGEEAPAPEAASAAAGRAVTRGASRTPS
jgi:predicted PurR-regulated permease PerM